MEEGQEKKNGLGQNTQKTQAWWQPAMALFLRMSVWIAVPVVLASFLGKYFDNRYQTEPWGLLGFIGISFIISMFGIIKLASQEYKKIELEKKEENK